MQQAEKRNPRVQQRLHKSICYHHNGLESRIPGASTSCLESKQTFAPLPFGCRISCQNWKHRHHHMQVSCMGGDLQAARSLGVWRTPCMTGCLVATSSLLSFSGRYVFGCKQATMDVLLAALLDQVASGTDEDGGAHREQ
jgi:hypothetical protein